MTRGQRDGRDATQLWGAKAFTQERRRRLFPIVALPGQLCCQTQPARHFSSNSFTPCPGAGRAGLIPVGRQCPVWGCQGARGSLSQLRAAKFAPASQSPPSAAPRTRHLLQKPLSGQSLSFPSPLRSQPRRQEPIAQLGILLPAWHTPPLASPSFGTSGKGKLSHQLPRTAGALRCLCPRSEPAGTPGEGDSPKCQLVSWAGAGCKPAEQGAGPQHPSTHPRDVFSSQGQESLRPVVGCSGVEPCL